MAVVMMLAMQTIVAALIFIHMIVPKHGCPKHVISPAQPKGELAQAGSLWRYLRRVYSVKEEAILKFGGADALLAMRRIEMRTLIVTSYMLVAVPLLVLYSLNVSGGATSGGLTRSTLANVAGLSAESLRLRLWAMIVGAYAVQILANTILEHYDESALEIIASSVCKAPGHHYAVVLRGLESDDDGVVKEAFENALRNRGSVLRVHSVKAYNLGAEQPKAPFLALRNEDDVVCCVSPWTSVSGYYWRRVHARRGGLRGLVASYLEALAATKQREEDGQPSKRWYREYAERCRLALAAGLERGAPRSHTAVVVLDSLWCSTTAVSTGARILGMPDGWSIEPAPEPRDIIWENLEDDRSYDTVRSLSLCGVYILSAACFSGIALGARIYARQGPANDNMLALMASGLIPVMLAKFVMGQSHAALRFTLYRTVESWTESRLTMATQREYARLLIVSALAVPLLSISLLSLLPRSHRDMLHEVAQQDHGSIFIGQLDVFRAFVIRKLPGLAFGFVAMLIFKAGDEVANQLLRLGAYVHFLKMKHKVLSRYGKQAGKAAEKEEEAVSAADSAAARNNKSKVPATRLRFDDVQDPTRTVVSGYDFSGQAGFEVFGLTVVAAWAPLAPAVVPLGIVYFVVALGVQRLSLSNTSCPKFNADGLFWRVDVRQTRHALEAALALHLLVCLFCGAIIHLLSLAPLVALAVYFESRAARRFATQNSHGVSAGRLSLTEAAALDARRAPNAAPHSCAAHCAQDLYWAPREEPPIVEADFNFYPGPPIIDDDDIEDRLGALEMWLARYDSKRAIPTFFESSPGVEDVVFKDSTVNKIADTVWRKMQHAYKRNAKGSPTDKPLLLRNPASHSTQPDQQSPLDQEAEANNDNERKDDEFLDLF